MPHHYNPATQGSELRRPRVRAIFFVLTITTVLTTIITAIVTILVPLLLISLLLITTIVVTHWCHPRSPHRALGMKANADQEA